MKSFEVLNFIRIALLVISLLCNWNLYAQNEIRIDSLKRLIDVAEDDSVKAEISFSIFLSLAETELRKSSVYAFEALEYASRSKSFRLQNKIAVTSGSFFLQKGLFDHAVFFYNAQLELGRKLENLSIVGKAYFNLGTVRLILEDYELAEEYFEKALDNLHRYNVANGTDLSPLERVTIDNALGLVNTGLGNYKKATVFLNNGIAVSKDDPKLRSSYTQISNNYADLLIKQNKIEEARSILEKMIKIEEEERNISGLIVSLLYLGNAELKSGNFLIAKKHLMRGMSLANKISGFSDKKHLSAALSRAYENLNLPDSALVYLNLSLSYEDSLSIQKAKDNLIKRELLEEFELFSKNLNLENKALKEKHLFFFFLLFLLLGLLIALYLIFDKKVKTSQMEYSELKKGHNEAINVNRKLFSEIELKKQEIILSQIQTTKSSELVIELASKIKENSSNTDKNLELKKLIDELKGSLGEKSWSELEIRFKKVHNNFYKNLLKDFPDLTLNEKRLAAFLKLQLTTKEIANLTGQSNRAVEIARTRLRKKIGLTNSDLNLNDFFLNFGSEENPSK